MFSPEDQAGTCTHSLSVVQNGQDEKGQDEKEMRSSKKCQKNKTLDS